MLLDAAALVSLGAPIENTNEPPTGCPSAETTRQLSTWLPRRSCCGVTVITLFSAAAAGTTTSPLGPISRITSTETGSLKVSFRTLGASETIAPSAGSVRTSDACAKAADDESQTVSRTAMKAKRATSARNTSALGQEPQARRRFGTAFPLCAMLAVLRYLDPAMDALLALLHDWEIDRLAGLEFLGKHAREHELVIVRIGELPARPGKLAHAFGHLGAAQRIGLGVFSAHDVELPARLRHRLHANDAFGNADADRGGGSAFATVRHAHDGLVGGRNRRLLLLQSDVRRCV